MSPAQTSSAARQKGAAGKAAATPQLPAEIFDAKVNVPLIHQVVVAQEAAAGRARMPPRPAATSAAAAGSRTGRRAPAARGRGPPARRSSLAAVSCTARTRAPTTSARPRR